MLSEARDPQIHKPPMKNSLSGSHSTLNWIRSFLLPLALSCSLGSSGFAGTQIESVKIPGAVLKGNPLEDPVERRVAVFSPELPKGSPSPRMVYYLPGYGASSEEFFGFEGWGFQKVVQELADGGIPVRVVVVNCKNRWGGSQYLNSPAQGNYADYVLDEIIPLVEKRFGVAGDPSDRIIAGHSSGGFGALRLAMQRPAYFGAVVALSPDTDLEVTHRHMVINDTVKHVSQRQLKAYMGPRGKMVEPSSGLIQMVLGLSAAYAPKGPEFPGEFHWPFDEQGRWDDAVWKKWLDQDPVVIARRNPKVFPPEQRIYLDGAEHDSFGAQKGARALRDAIQGQTKVEFYESPGGHSDHVGPRFARGLEWVSGRTVRPIH